MHCPWPTNRPPKPRPPPFRHCCLDVGDAGASVTVIEPVASDGVRSVVASKAAQVAGVAGSSR